MPFGNRVMLSFNLNLLNPLPFFYTYTFLSLCLYTQSITAFRAKEKRITFNYFIPPKVEPVDVK